MSDMRVGDIGTTIELDCVVDVSGASVMRIRYKKPDGVLGYWTAIAGGTATKVKYVTSAAGDVAAAGEWVLQTYVEKGAWKRSGDFFRMEVGANLV
jgi:hypothetical protein